MEASVNILSATAPIMSATKYMKLPASENTISATESNNLEAEE